jgi:hypothetical protein
VAEMAGDSAPWHSKVRLITLTIKTMHGFALGGSVATVVNRAPLVSYSGYCSVPYRASGEPTSNNQEIE